MIFKLVLNNEIHRVNTTLKTFQQMQELIQSRYSDRLPSSYCVEYVDNDGDMVRISNEEDFSILSDDFETLKSVKLFIKSHQEVVESNLEVEEEVDEKETSVIVFNDYPEVENVMENDKVVEQKPEVVIPEETNNQETPVEVEEKKENDEKEVKSKKQLKFEKQSMKFENFLKGWLNRFDNLMEKQNTLVVMRQGKRRVMNLFRKAPKGTRKYLKTLFSPVKSQVKTFFKQHKGIKQIIKNHDKGRKQLNKSYANIQEKRQEVLEKLNNFSAILKEVLVQLKDLKVKDIPVESNSSQSSESSESSCERRHRRGRRHHFGRKMRFWKKLKQMCTPEEFEAKKLKIQDMKRNLSKKEWQEKKREMWKKMFSDNESSKSSSNESGSRKRCHRRRGGRFRRGPQFFKHMVKSQCSKEEFQSFKEVFKQMKQNMSKDEKKAFWRKCLKDSSSSKSDSSTSSDSCSRRKSQKGRRGRRRHFMQKYKGKFSPKQWKNMKNNLTKEEWMQKKRHWKKSMWKRNSSKSGSDSSSSSSSERSGERRHHGGGWWRKVRHMKKQFWNDLKSKLTEEQFEAKKQWFRDMKEKMPKRKWMKMKFRMMKEHLGVNMNNMNHKWQRFGKWRNNVAERVQNRIDSTINQAIPQIAQQVAQILNVNHNQVSNDLPRKERIEKAKSAGIPIHFGYTCDGCSVKPIIGDLYKCSVKKDFDYCSTCEATKPHKFPFLKIKSPEQRPDVIFTVMQDQHDRPNPKLVKKCKKQFKQWVEGIKTHLKKKKQCSKQNKKGGCGSCKKKNQKKEAIFVGAEIVEAKVEDKQDINETQVTELPEPVIVDVEEKEPEIVVCTFEHENVQKLMEFFDVDQNNRGSVIDFVKGKEAMSISDLTNLFIDDVLPQLK